MMLTLLVATSLLHLVCGYPEEIYSGDLDSFYPEELPEDDVELRRRSSNFLRFGRGDFDDYGEDFARPTRSGNTEKNDHFIRFGRSKQDFLRFGRDQHKARNANYLRFGRSTQDGDESRRTKRETFGEYKRGGSNFLRFGRNSNFLRFGRNNMMAATPDPEKTPLIQLLSELIENLKKEQGKAV